MNVEVVIVDLRGVPDGVPVARHRSDRTRAALLQELSVGAEALRRTATGKPYLPGSPTHFNVSHSHELGAVALARTDVGVDVEALDGPKRRKVLPGVLSDSERAWVTDVGTFLRAWTRKEALLKAIGAGIGVRLEQASIEPSGTVSALPEGLGDPGAWFVVDLQLDGYFGAVAARAKALEVTLRR